MNGRSLTAALAASLLAVFSYFEVQPDAMGMRDGSYVSVESISLNDQIADMTATYMEKGPFVPGDPYTPVQLYFSGDKTLTGTYRVSEYGPTGKQVCLYPDKESRDSLPKIRNDNKIVCLNGEPEIMNSFPSDEGTAKVTIKEYQILHFPDDMHNAAMVTSVSF